MSFNRLSNASNRFQNIKKFVRILTVCSAGLLRSPTIARVLTKDFDNVNIRSCGVDKEFALIPLDPVLLEWADIVICAEKSHELAVLTMLKENNNIINDTPIVLNFDIPDMFEFGNPKLEEIIRQRINDRFMEELAELA